MKLCIPVTPKEKQRKNPRNAYELDLKGEYSAMFPLFILLEKKVTSL